VPKAARVPQRKVVDGVEYLSVTAAAQTLNRSERTLRRLEAAGIIPRPRHQFPGGRPDMRWYSQADLDELRQLVADSGFAERQAGSRSRLKDLLAALPGQARNPVDAGQRSSWSGEDVSRRPRELLRRRPIDDDFEWLPPFERRRAQLEEARTDPLPAAELCPQCGVEVLWITQPLPGGGLTQVPVCEQHGLVDLSAPAVDPDRCACGLEYVWEIRDGLPGFQPTCPVCGPADLMRRAAAAPKPSSSEPFRNMVNFNLAAPERPRARGLRQADVVGAIRAPRRQEGPRITFIDSYGAPTRPS
jgi:hypothetical protein